MLMDYIYFDTKYRWCAVVEYHTQEVVIVEYREERAALGRPK